MLLKLIQNYAKCLCEQSVIDHSVTSSSHSVNGDIAVQWEWSNFDHS